MRAPAVAGQFYPGRKSELENMLAEMMPPTAEHKAVFGVMSPHAGYIYSGRTAAATLSGVDIPQEVVILGPNHHGRGHAAAVYAHGGWSMPLGTVPIAESLANAILTGCPYMADDIVAHRYEHSLEVQVPFLQKLNPEVQIVPICIGPLPLKVLLSLGDCLATVIKDRPVRPLVLASTDMTHYESGRVAKQKDSMALDRILNMDPEGLYNVVRDNRISMCGVLPVVVMLRAAVALGYSQAELVDYCNSGDVTGDQSEVVGYAGVRVH